MLRVHSKCMGMMHHRFAQKRGIWRFSGGLGSNYQAKSWMVGRYADSAYILTVLLLAACHCSRHWGGVSTDAVGACHKVWSPPHTQHYWEPLEGEQRQGKMTLAEYFRQFCILTVLSVKSGWSFMYEYGKVIHCYSWRFYPWLQQSHWIL